MENEKQKNKAHFIILLNKQWGEGYQRQQVQI